MGGNEFLSDEERAAARHLLGQCLEVRRCSAKVLRDQLLIEDQACDRLAREIEELGNVLWDAILPEAKRFRSELVRRDLDQGRELYPVTIHRMDPVVLGC